MNNQIPQFGRNLKFLRERLNTGQENLALLLDFKRGKLASYETGVAKNPPLVDLIKISDHFKISIDMLIREELGLFSEIKLADIQSNFNYAKSHEMRVLAVTVNDKGKENIEYVPVKVRAGYLAGYNDPEFIKELPKISLPFVSKSKTMRMFESEGDSMLPLPSNCKILGEYVEDWHEIKDGNMYIVISEKGYAIKKVYKKLDNNSITLKSLNPLYVDYEIYLSEVYEIWKFVLYISNTLPDQFVNSDEILAKIEEMKLLVLKGKISA
ncbi:MAG: helix-turn-helix domain-containing protein [Opitutaceae bacterium]|nr:helix-turn-helix domain-containing protein [Cytophagales bacterium]